MWHYQFAGTIYLASAAALVTDLWYDIAWASGVLYIPAVCTAVFYRSRRCAWWLAATAIIMVGLGAFFPVPNFTTTSLTNRGLSIVAIIITAALVDFARAIRVRLEQQTARAQAADRMKMQILANLSHELRTPLNAIIGFSELLMTNCRPDQQGWLEDLRSSGQRLLVTIENLLDLARSTDWVLRTDRLDLAAILRQAIDAARSGTAERRITLLNDVASNLPSVTGDGWAVRRIADNLISNAVKFSAPGGSVRIATETEGGSVFAVVEDTGSGMSAEVLHQLGEPFFQAEGGTTRSFEGLGTGLALCRRLADAMGARLDFKSEPGQGTTVRLELPVA